MEGTARILEGEQAAMGPLWGGFHFRPSSGSITAPIVACLPRVMGKQGAGSYSRGTSSWVSFL